MLQFVHNKNLLSCYFSDPNEHIQCYVVLVMVYRECRSKCMQACVFLIVRAEVLIIMSYHVISIYDKKVCVCYCYVPLMYVVMPNF